MLLIHEWTHFPAQFRGGVLCVGNFDGVHIGHAQMLATGRDEAHKRGVPFTIMTFDPHPQTVLKPQMVRHPLLSFAQRQEHLKEFSPDVLLVVQPTREFLSIMPEDFLRNIVRGTATSGFGAILMVEGPTFSFGKAAGGHVEMLRQMGPALGFETIVVPTREEVLSDMTIFKVSSSVIRWMIERGRVRDAAKALGRPHTVRGEVVRGAQRGRTIGFPTANVRTMQMIPGPGVYAGEVVVDGKTHAAAISVGTNPTFGDNATTVEAFLLDFSADLYGRTIDLAFTHWVREMLTFAGVEPLVAQMTRDVALTRQLAGLTRS